VHHLPGDLVAQQFLVEISEVALKGFLSKKGSDCSDVGSP
jgi:hypothetical protein